MIHSRCKIRTNVYASEIHKNISYVDYVVLIKFDETEDVCKIKFFFKANEEQFCLVERLSITDRKNQYIFVNDTNALYCVRADTIKQKLIYVRVATAQNATEVVIRRPNSYECD